MRAAWGGGSGLVPALRIAPLDRWLHIVEASTAPRTVVCASPLRSNREFQRRGRGRAGQVRARAGARPARQHMYLEMYYRRAVQGDVQFRGDIIPIYIPVESASALADRTMPLRPWSWTRSRKQPALQEWRTQSFF